uniref:Uncharacterized protein n=1 Tax=Chrysemys picta bellii TaxID=8478 RepID=A0A8C3I2J4_CHRPI
MHLARSTVEAAREKLQNSIFDRMNVHNVLLYEVTRRGGMLEELEATQDPSLLQVIRQLENNIEKMLMKIRTGEKIYYLYLKMVDFLKDELAQLPLQLDVLQHMVEVYQVELKGMRLMAVDATEATEAAKTDMTNMETEFIAERRFRENSLNFQKKQIDRIRVKDASESCILPGLMHFVLMPPLSPSWPGHRREVPGPAEDWGEPATADSGV